MKKLLYTLTASLLLLTSCNADNDNFPADQKEDANSNKQSVTLKLNVASSLQNRSIDNSTSDLEINQIIYAVFKEDNRVIQGAVVQPKDDPEGYSLFQYYDKVTVTNNTLPSINFDLEEGNYYIAILATGRNEDAAKYINNPVKETSTLSETFFIINETSSPNEFMATLPITVGNSHLDVDAELNRAVGKVEIIITDLDKLPATVQSISTRIETYTGLSSYWTPTAPFYAGLTSKKHAQYNTLDIDVPLLTRDQFANHGIDNPIIFYGLQTKNSGVSGVPNITAGGDLYLYLNTTTTKPSGNVSANKKVLVSKSVDIYPNKISRFKGKVTGNDYGFSLSVKQEWDGDATIIEIEK